MRGIQLLMLTLLATAARADHVVITLSDFTWQLTDCWISSDPCPQSMLDSMQALGPQEVWHDGQFGPPPELDINSPDMTLTESSLVFAGGCAAGQREPSRCNIYLEVTPGILFFCANCLDEHLVGQIFWPDPDNNIPVRDAPFLGSVSRIGQNGYSFDVSGLITIEVPTQVPEPSTLLLVVTGLVVLSRFRRISDLLY